jgi:hypothetical protein
MLSILNKINKFYFTKSVRNIHHFIIFVSVLSFVGIIYGNSQIQISEAQSTNNAQIQNGNVNPQASPSTGNNFIISGPLSSFLSTPSGNWVVSGNWTLEVQNGNISDFNANMQWDPTNLTKLTHSHNFANFRADPNTQTISLGPERIIDVKGIMDIGANNKIEWTDVPAEIKTTGNTITVSILDDAKTGNHFNNYPIFGKIGKVSQINTNAATNPTANNIQSSPQQQPIQTQSNQAIQSSQQQQQQPIQTQSNQAIQSSQQQQQQPIQTQSNQAIQSSQQQQQQPIQTQSNQAILPPHQSIKSFKMEGIIDSTLYIPSGGKWNTAGTWTLVVDNGKLALFSVNTTWQNETGSHTHEFLNFKSKTKNIILKPTNDLSLKGVMDVGTNNQISWPSVPTTVNIASGKTITISIDDSKTNHHFANQPIHGIMNKLTLCSNTPVSNMQVLPRCT